MRRLADEHLTTKDTSPSGRAPGAPLTGTGTRTGTRTRAVLVAVQLPGVTDDDHASDLEELARLVRTLGFDVAGTVSQRRDALAAAAVLGEGKLKELAGMTGGKGLVPSGAPEVKTKARAKWAAARHAMGKGTEDASGPRTGASPSGDDDESEAQGGEPSLPKPDVVIVDHEISPSQARNLERATGARVLDRTGVIVDIFHRHARSREAKLQVEIARLNYVAPRLRESPGGKERQRGKGAGEAAIELDRRKIRDRVAELREQIAAIQKENDNRRQGRHDQLRVALVGYTNAGKSSWMRALTRTDVLVEDKLFATLDTTVRALQPETKPRVLVSDTVGFIKKLPHDLVASFRSTLDEALEASLLFYVVDASDPTHEAQLQVTRDVLREIGADAVPAKLLFNKADRLDAAEKARVMHEHPDALLLSAHAPADVTSLRATILQFFDDAMVEAELVVPYSKQSLIGDVYENAKVLAEEYDDAGTHLRLRGLPGAIARLKRAAEAGR
jgi:GTP-binding protein HflX